MIEVIVNRAPYGIKEVCISGHANAAAYGSDIVCSAVSAISFGILNAIHPLLGIVPQVSQAPKDGGFLRWSISSLEDAALHEKQQLLAESMVISLLAVAEQYGSYVSVQDDKWQGGASQ
ncbi:ribosomal-processing cysteine protease Prp [Brevibacillus borstelensis]|uniref:ribosomal-processing cysteine protease Prp n=1 Tax=Brevibacillus borstelensis TaxID=45462 RepID=UPI002E1B363F|nr:ribosomal-processing cysteine protease Prp [Brevibacillus borstelensis]